MASFTRILSNNEYSQTGFAETAIPLTVKPRRRLKLWLAASTATIVIASAGSAVADDIHGDEGSGDSLRWPGL